MTYDRDFYARNLKFQTALAEHLTPWIVENLHPASVIDFGCGCGYLLNSIGAKTVVGLNYNRPENLQINVRDFMTANFSAPVYMKKIFDLAMSLEVAEHLPENCADIFIDSLTRHSHTIIFSAATPGQGGVEHINEQPPEYWHKKFKSRGYACYDIIRPILQGKKSVPFWYRQNIFLYRKIT